MIFSSFSSLCINSKSFSHDNISYSIKSLEDEVIAGNRCPSKKLFSCIYNNNMKTNLEIFHILIRN